MRLDHDLFPVNVIDFENKKVLVHSSQAKKATGKNVLISDRLEEQVVSL